MPRTIQVFEHQKLTLHKDQWGQQLTERELAKLYEFNDKNDNKYFTGIRDGIKFTSHVGVIQIGGLIIEILPKADRRIDSDPNEHARSTKKWRNALLQMLAICRRVKLESISVATLEKRHHSILDLYVNLFLDEVEALLHRGLIKRYRSDEGNINVLKGRLDFSKNLNVNLVHRERFYTHHQVYDQNNLLNQILHCALAILKNLTASSFAKDRISRILLNFPQVNEVAIQRHHFDRVSLDRKTSHYDEAIKIAEMIILNYSPDIRGGGEDMLALLFDMNKLWEEYIYRCLKGVDDKSIKVYFQNSEQFWEQKTIRPDLVITRGTVETFILDTKWKLIFDSEPDDDDLKQVFSYNLHWNSYHGILLYPTTAFGSKHVTGGYYKGMTCEHCCSVAFINVLDEFGRLNQNCGEEIIQLLDLHKERPEWKLREQAKSTALS
jgi:5-methylcytosine-specific restriction enzyme subunit McrC